MVIGSGLMANVFREYTETEGFTIFASGVSDSSCTQRTEFERESKLLSSIDCRTKLVYFSTASLSDGTRTSMYTNHKYEMESLVRERFDHYLILRLPTVVGRGGNSNNFFNYLTEMIRNGCEITIQKNLYRSLIDADHITKLTGILIEKLDGVTIDISLDNQSTVGQIVSDIEDNIGIKTSKIELETETNKPIDSSKLRNLNPVEFKNLSTIDYNKRLIKKYLKL